MATRDTTSDVAELRIRPCSNCGGEREHRVVVHLRGDVTREAVQPRNGALARRQYRILECLYCGRSRKEGVA